MHVGLVDTVRLPDDVAFGYGTECVAEVGVPRHVAAGLLRGGLMDEFLYFTAGWVFCWVSDIWLATRRRHKELQELLGEVRDVVDLLKRKGLSGG